MRGLRVRLYKKRIPILCVCKVSKLFKQNETSWVFDEDFVLNIRWDLYLTLKHVNEIFFWGTSAPFYIYSQMLK